MRWGEKKPKRKLDIKSLGTPEVREHKIVNSGAVHIHLPGVKQFLFLIPEEWMPIAESRELARLVADAIVRAQEASK